MCTSRCGPLRGAVFLDSPDTDDPQAVVMGTEPVCDGTGPSATSPAPLTAAPRAHAWLPAELATPGTTRAHRYFDQSVEARSSSRNPASIRP
ncbi:hypothetical protein ACFS5L_05420 [Streptomyces phyllanthi]|uniref:hypothetical protein n=1 Tax=Streptomyces phyllanthi TaxID=1803180 RepID=UPI0036346C92